MLNLEIFFQSPVPMLTRIVLFIWAHLYGNSDSENLSSFLFWVITTEDEITLP